MMHSTITYLVGKDHSLKPITLYVTSVVDGGLRLSEDEKVEIPESAKELRKKVVALLPKVSLADLLIEVDSWVEVREHFTHAGR